jgi:putative FmdB family regulatory protein
MPLFEYTCDKCRYRFDRVVARWDTPVKCPICRSDVTKLMSTFAVHGSHKSATDNLPVGQPKMCTNC